METASYFLFKIKHSWVDVEMLTFIAAMSLSYDSLIFFITSSSALEHASMEPFTVMVRSGLYRVKSWRLDGTAVRVYDTNQTHFYQLVSAALRWNCDLGPRVLFDFLQIAALLPNQSSYKVVVRKYLQWDLLSAAQDGLFVYSSILNLQPLNDWASQLFHIQVWLIWIFFF